MDIVKLYNDHGVPAKTEGHKHCREGWVNTMCPFCTGNPGYHLGATLDGKIFYCWRCGIHFADKTIAALLNVSFQQARQLIIQYAGISRGTKELKRKIRTKSFKYPSNVSNLIPTHKDYLISRGFQPEIIESKWGLLSSKPISLLDTLDYSRRILVPISWGNKVVSFQGRDVTEKHILKYMACPQSRELVNHKHIIYRHPDYTERKGICVEGVTDVWRFGEVSFCTFGIKYTRQQLRLISELYDEVKVIFDDESQAIKQAKKLAADLRFRGVKAEVIIIKGDPGSMKQEEADKLLKTIL